MPPTPTRTVQRGSVRQRQGSSLHPQPGSGAAGMAGLDGMSAQHAKVGRGPNAADAAGVPFVHPALALSSGVLPSSSSTAGLPPAVAAQIRGRRPFNHRNLFARDLRNLMYAYGDSPDPDPDSVMLMEEMTVDFITDLCCRARPSPYSLGLGTSSISNSSSAFGATLENSIANDGSNATRSSPKPGASAVSKRRAERAGALQTDNLPPAPSNGDASAQDANMQDLDDDDLDDKDAKIGKPGKAKSKANGPGKGGAKGKGKPKAAAASRAGSARSSVAPS
ncbi:hypothetical protein L1887_56912 [Cichorium endivia]|nr:hypothetical protein L1887_56912 [Cichorium endivia]